VLLPSPEAVLAQPGSSVYFLLEVAGRLTGWLLKVLTATVFTRCLKVKTSLIYVSTKF
jgi:hypothetical protein